MSAVRAVTGSELDALLAGETRPVVIDFWAHWCGPCRQMDPILADLSVKREGREVYVSVNIDDEPEVAADYGVLAIPTFIVMRGGEPVARWVGARTAQAFDRNLEQLTKAADD